MTAPRVLALASLLLPACLLPPGTPRGAGRPTVVGTWRCTHGCDRGDTVDVGVATEGLSTGPFRAWRGGRLVETGTWRRTGDSLVVVAGGGLRTDARIRRLTADTLVLDGDVRTTLVRRR